MLHDVELTDGGQLEDNLTRALAIALERASQRTLASFLDIVCGVSLPDAAVTNRRLELQPGAEQAAETRIRRLVAISPAGRLNRSEFEEGPGGSRPDLLLVIPGQVLIVVENKARNGTDGEQLWRHARAHGLPVPQRRAGGLQIPDEWVQRSWREIARWAEISGDSEPVAAYLLSELAEYLHLSGVTGRSIPQPPAGVVELDPAHDELLTSLAEATNLDEVASRVLPSHQRCNA